MPISRQLVPWALGVTLAACGSNPVVGRQSGFEHAAAVRQCGPADGPAVSILLAAAAVESAQPPRPYVQINVWQPLERITERTWILTETAQEGAAAYFRAGADIEVATSGRVTVTDVAADTTFTGSATLDFPTTGRIEVDFTAPWIASTMLCG